MTKALVNAAKGVAVGVATLVPGMSGGTMAIILGIYDGLIHAVGSFFTDWKKHTVFLLEVGAGALLGILAFSWLLEAALTTFPFAMKFLFMGIIVGGLPTLYGRSRRAGARHWTDYPFFIAGFILVFLLSAEPEAAAGLVTASGVKGIVSLFVAGVVIAIALVLPGISASFVLLTLGLYSVTLGAINTVNIPILVPLLLGVAVGTFATTNVIERFMARFPNKAYMLILGFVAGSLHPVFPGITAGMEMYLSVVLFIVGAVAIFGLGRTGLVE
jgi:putative membrane protein